MPTKPRLVSAYRKDTGEKVRIPRHWLDDPKAGAPFSLTPSQRARDTRSTEKAPAAGEKE